MLRFVSMSGHSKWAQIKRQKGTADIKKGQTFTKVANAIIIAVRQGGGNADPESSFKLRLAIEKARAVNMPKENIQRALRRAQGKQEGGELQEVVYEGFGPGGVAVMVECVTDNKERTRFEVKNVFDKSGGTLGQPGSVSYQFKQVGLLTVKKDGLSFDEIFSKAADVGATDVEEAGLEAMVYTDPSHLRTVKDALISAGLSVVEAQLDRKATVTVPISNKENSAKVLLLVEKLESLDDVQKVYTNAI